MMTFICDDTYNCVPYECSSEVFSEQLKEYFENLENAQIKNCEEILTLNSYLITFLLIGLSVVTYNYSLIERQLNFYRKKYAEFIVESDSEDNSDDSENQTDDSENPSDDPEDQSDDSENQSDDSENQSDDPENPKEDSDEDLVKVSDSEKTELKTTRSGWFY